MFDLKSFLKKSWKEGTQADRGNILTSVLIGAPSHLLLYFLYTYVIPLPYESLTLRLSLVFLCSSTGLYWYLPKRIREVYFPFYWHLMIIASLNFNATFLLLKNNFNEIYLYWEIFVTFLLTMYVPNWFIFLVDFLLAVSSAILLYVLTTPVIDLTPSFNILGYSLILLFTAVSGIIFVYANRSAWLAKQDRQYKALISLAGSVVHEIRNPLNSISLVGSSLQDLLDVGQDGKAKLANLTGSIFDSVKQANEIINIALSDLQNKPINSHEFCCLMPNKVLPEIVLKYGYANEEERTKVNLNLGSESDNFVFKAVPERFIFIMYNLIKNALYYLKEYPNSLVTIGTEERVIDDKVWSVIYVQDTGPGIPQDALPKLFGDFYTSGKKEGTGLGLAFCKRNMKAFGGDIICESEFGNGKPGWTKFSLLFPKVDEAELARIGVGSSKDLDAADDKNKERKSKAIVGVRSRVDKVKILVVDDEKTNLLITKSMIEKNLDVVCELAHDGKEAAEIEKHHIEDHRLILTDIQMPKVGGVVAAKNIRSFNKDIPIVALTSLEYEELQKDDHNYFNDHLNKPVLGHILYRTVSKFIPDLDDPMDYLGDAEQYLPDVKSKKILIADDQELNLSIFAKKLQNLGMEVTKTTDGKELIEAYKNSIVASGSVSESGNQNKKSSFDIIVTDINMPIMSGDEATQEIRKLEIENNISYKNRLPIIALSGDGQVEDIMHFFESGMTDYFIKGSDVNRLIKLLVIYLNPSKTYKSFHHKKEDEQIKQNIDVLGFEAKIINHEKLSNFGKYDKKAFLKIFLEGSQNQLEKIKKAIDENNKEELSIALHALKGISGNVGADKIFYVVSKASHNIKNNIALEGGWYEGLEIQYDALKGELEKIIS